MEENTLNRNVGWLSATSIGLGAMLGAGIFIFPGLAGGYAGFGAIVSFALGGIIALLVAACTSELATAMPQSGGGYYFVSRSFGGLWGTLAGISQWIGLIFACSFYMVSFGEYVQTLLEELEVHWNVSTAIVPIGFTGLLLALNIIGTRKVGRVQNAMVISLTVLLLLVFTYGVIDYFGLKAQEPFFEGVAPKGTGSVFSATALIFTSYLGFLQIANLGGEIKNPGVYLPRSLIWSVLTAMVLYMFVMGVCSLTLSPDKLRNFGENATIEVARIFLGKWGAVPVVFAGVLAALSSANASMISASRGVFALSKDGVIPDKAGAINKRFGTPHIALILVTIPIGIMLLRSELEIFAEVASSLHLVIYAGICASVLKLRAAPPAWYVPTFRVRAVRVVAGLGVVCCIVLLGFMQKASILLSLGVLAVATAYHFLYARQHTKRFSPPEPPHLRVNLLNPRILIPVDLSQDRKELPDMLLEALPVSEVLLLGYRETPEQTPSEQSEETYREEGEAKLSIIIEALEEAGVTFDTKMIFSHRIAAQVKEIIEEEELEFILTLQPLSQLNRVLIPIYDPAQVDNALSTALYNLSRQRSARIKVLLFPNALEEGFSSEDIKGALENRLRQLQISVHEYEEIQAEDGVPTDTILEHTGKTDLLVWPEGDPTRRNAYLKFILGRAPKGSSSPSIMILKSGSN